MKLQADVFTRILGIVKKARPGSCNVKIGRKSIFDWHCGQRMQRIKVFYPNVGSGGGEYEAANQIICMKCNYNFTRGGGQSLTGA